MENIGCLRKTVLKRHVTGLGLFAGELQEGLRYQSLTVLSIWSNLMIGISITLRGSNEATWSCGWQSSRCRHVIQYEISSSSHSG